MPGYLLKSFEILTLLLFLATPFFLFRKKRFGTLVVMGMTLFSATIAELINEFVTQVTSYNPSFIFKAPHSEIPLFIIAGAALLSAGIFEGAVFADSCFRKQSRLRAMLFAFLLSIPLPLFEIMGIESGMWKWLHECNIYNPFWLFGVWKYYAFVISPAIIACFFRRAKMISEAEQTS